MNKWEGYLYDIHFYTFTYENIGVLLSPTNNLTNETRFYEFSKCKYHIISIKMILKIFFYIFTDIGTEENSNIASFYTKGRDELFFPMKSKSEILSKYNANRIRISITHDKRLLLFINKELKYHFKLPFLIPIRYISFTNLNGNDSSFHFNCRKRTNKLANCNVNYLLTILFIALLISFCINVFTFSVIFIAWRD